MKLQKMVNAAILGGFLLGGALVLPASAEVLQDEMPGSFLVFPIFDIRSGRSTQIRICDKSNGPGRGEETTWVRLNFICGGVLGDDADPFCDQYDTDFVLTGHQCKIIDVAEYGPPCNQGFVVAFAENASFQPWAYDHLIGSYHITTGTGDSAVTAAAKAIAIQSNGNPFQTVLGQPRTDDPSSTDLVFAQTAAANVDYVGLPAQLHSDFRAVQGIDGPDSETTLLTLLTLNINSGTDNNTTSVKFAWWDLEEVNHSASHKFVCWDRVRLNRIDSHFTAAGLTTSHGSLRITPSPTSCNPAIPRGEQCTFGGLYSPAVLGALQEVGPGAPGTSTLRHFFHTGTASIQHYSPE